jgi:magnesium-transporting ATPase (P-type)
MTPGAASGANEDRCLGGNRCGQIGREHRSDGTWARGIVAAVKEGRMTFQRILTYTLRSMTRKINQMLFLTVGLIMTGHAILTPMLMFILMTTGDFLAMSSTMDNVRPSAKPKCLSGNILNRLSGL